MQKNRKARVKSMADADAKMSFQKTADCLGIDLSSVSRIFNKKLDYRKASARWNPPVLTPENKRDRLQYSKALLTIYRYCEPKYLDEIVTSDEPWVHMYEPLRKSQNEAWAQIGRNLPQIVS